MSAPIQSLVSSAQTLTGTFTAGNTIVVSATATTFAGSINSITTNHSETMVLVDTTIIDALPHIGTAAYLLNCVGGSTTITVNTTHGTAWNIVCYEYAASDAVSFDTHAVSPATTGTNPASATTSTTSSANETVVGWLSEVAAPTPAPTAGTGFGHIVVATPGSPDVAAMEDKTVSSTGTQQATFVNSASGVYVCGVLTFVKSAPVVAQSNYVISF